MAAPVALARDRRTLAVCNNAEWYAAIARVHAIRGRYESGMWLSDAVMPPYHSNGVTVSPTEQEAQYKAIARLRSGLSREFSIKDGFCNLDLSSRGFSLLFEAEWIWLAAADPHRASRGTRWQSVTSEADLAAWEAAWNDADSPADTRVFPAAVLSEGSITLLTASRGGNVVAGCAANRGTGGVVGLSNFFALMADADELFAGATAAVAATAPGSPIVGYERGPALDRALRLGFESMGRLRVWSVNRAAAE
jgi:hypothetical protein